MEIGAAKLIGAGMAVLGVIGPGIGIGLVFAAYIQAVGRNPAAHSAVFTWTMVGFALVEALAIFALLIAFLLLYTF
ncbi:MAG: F0F1 ATP synthase subunit C [Rhodospirillales bacterium]|nr:F0F1 ATP synthase subunit C [Rhodospirillales bacterium]